MAHSLAQSSATGAAGATSATAHHPPVSPLSPTSAAAQLQLNDSRYGIGSQPNTHAHAYPPAHTPLTPQQLGAHAYQAHARHMPHAASHAATLPHHASQQHTPAAATMPMPPTTSTAPPRESWDTFTARALSQAHAAAHLTSQARLQRGLMSPARPHPHTPPPLTSRLPHPHPHTPPPASPFNMGVAGTPGTASRRPVPRLVPYTHDRVLVVNLDMICAWPLCRTLPMLLPYLPLCRTLPA